MADEGTTYVKLTKNANGKVSKIIMSEDTFAENKKDTKQGLYGKKALPQKKMILTLNGEENYI